MKIGARTRLIATSLAVAKTVDDVHEWTAEQADKVRKFIEFCEFVPTSGPQKVQAKALLVYSVAQNLISLTDNARTIRVRVDKDFKFEAVLDSGMTDKDLVFAQSVVNETKGLSVKLDRSANGINVTVSLKGLWPSTARFRSTFDDMSEVAQFFSNMGVQAADVDASVGFLKYDLPTTVAALDRAIIALNRLKVLRPKAVKWSGRRITFETDLDQKELKALSSKSLTVHGRSITLTI